MVKIDNAIKVSMAEPQKAICQLLSCASKAPSGTPVAIDNESADITMPMTWLSR